MTIVSHTIYFTGTPVSGSAPLTVTFTNLSSAISGTLTGSSWTFGDGGTSSVFSPTYTYTTPGVYTVALTQSFSAYPTGTLTNTNYITVTGVTSYTLAYADNGTTKTITDPIVTVVIPNDTEAPTITPGYSVIVHNSGTGTATISPDSPATVSGPTSILSGQSVLISKTASNTWTTLLLYGGGNFTGVKLTGIKIGT